LERLFITLINDMVAASESFILALADCDAIETPTTHKVVSFLLDPMSPPDQALHLAIAAHAPSLRLARLRARGQLTELHAADLSFTHSEELLLVVRCYSPDVAQQAQPIRPHWRSISMRPSAQRSQPERNLCPLSFMRASWNWGICPIQNPPFCRCAPEKNGI
jgi:hypothetical protein